MWIQTIITFDSAVHLHEQGFDIALLIENICGTKHLYFSHNTNKHSPILNVVLETEKDILSLEANIKEQFNGIIKIEIINCEQPGSVVHAYGFEIAKLLRGKSQKEIANTIGDSTHWTLNMLGMSYSEEFIQLSLWTNEAFNRVKYFSKS